MKKRILILTSLAVLLFSGKNARANEAKQYFDRWNTYSLEYEKLFAEVTNLEDELKEIKKNPDLAKKLKPTIEKIQQAIQIFKQKNSDKIKAGDKYAKDLRKATPWMAAYHKGKHVIWMNLLIIGEAYDYLQEVSPKLAQCLASLGPDCAEQQAQYDDYMQQFNGTVEVLKPGEHPRHIDPSLIPREGIKLPLLGTAQDKKQEMDQVIFRKGIIPRGQKIHYDFLESSLSKKVCGWHKDMPNYKPDEPVKLVSDFWYNDTSYQIKSGKKPNSKKANSEKPKLDPVEEQQRQEEKKQRQDFDRQVETFLKRLAHEKGYQGGEYFYHSYYVFSDYIKNEYLAMRQKALDAGQPITDLSAFEETILRTDPQIIFREHYYHPGINSLWRMSQAVKRVVIGELAQQTLRRKITPLTTEMEQILQVQEPIVAESLNEFNGLTEELKKKREELKPKLETGVIQKIGLSIKIDSILKKDPLPNGKQKKFLKKLVQEEANIGASLKAKQDEITREDHEQQALVAQNQKLQQQKNDLLKKIDDLKASPSAQPKATDLPQREKQIETWQQELSTLAVEAENNQESLKKLQLALQACLQQQRQEEETDAINNEAVKVATEEIAKLQEQLKQCQVELEKTKFRSGVFSDQEVLALTAQLQELKERIQRNQADADHYQQHQQEYLALFQQLMSLSAELQHQKELQGELNQSIEQLKREFEVVQQRNLKLVNSLQKLQAEVQARQQTMDLLSGIDHCSKLILPPVFCYSRVQNIRDENIRYMIRGTLALGLDHVDLDCHGLTTKDIKKYVHRVIKIIGEIDFSAVPEKTLQINFIPGHGRHSVITEFSVIKEELIKVLQNLEINILESNHHERGIVKAVFDQRFLFDNPHGFKIRKINYGKLRGLVGK